MEENELVKIFWWADGKDQLLLKTSVKTREDLWASDIELILLKWKTVKTVAKAHVYLTCCMKNISLSTCL